MKYDKPPLKFEQQAELFISRGLIAEKSLLIERLKNVSYYRLSGYLFPYRNIDDTFKTGTTLNVVWRHYTFDRTLRFIIMDAIERVEVSVRTQLIEELSHSVGPFGYLEKSAFPKLDNEKYAAWLKKIKEEIKRSKNREHFVDNFFAKYGDCHKYLPLWMTGEIMSFGSTLTMFNGAHPEIKRKLANYYKIPDEVLKSWLLTLNTIRNICAHHGKLWDRELRLKPKKPNYNKYREWYEPVGIQNNRIFVILTILKFLLRTIAPQSMWDKRLLRLFDEYKDISLIDMGFPEKWKESPLWK